MEAGQNSGEAAETRIKLVMGKSVVAYVLRTFPALNTHPAINWCLLRYWHTKTAAPRASPPEKANSIGYTGKRETEGNEGNREDY